MDNQWKLSELEQILIKMEARVTDYYNRKKGISEPQKGTRKRLRKQLPFENNVNNPEDQKKKREQKKANLENHNELFYFGPARTAAALTREALKRWKQGDKRAAIKKQLEATEHSNHIDFEFNLGKMYIESGFDYKEGLFHLLNYYVEQDESDNHKAELHRFFNIEMEDNIYYGCMKNGLTQIEFELSGNEFTFTEEESFNTSIPLPFKIPVSLDLERKDKERIKLRDYWYLTALHDSGEEDVCTYEIKIHKNKAKEFIEDFYSTVIELSMDGKMKELSSFEKLKHILYLNNLKKQYYTQGTFGEPFEVAFPQDTSLISILLIEIPLQNNQEFLDLFKSFALNHLYLVDSSDEIDEEEVRELEEMEYAAFAEWEAMQSKVDDYNSFLNQSELFADLTVLLDNLKLDKPDPYNAKNEALHLSAKQQYLNHLGDLFAEMDKVPSKKRKIEVTQPKDELLEEIDNILMQIKSEKVRHTLKTLLYDARKILDASPRQSVGSMRLTLEILIKETCITAGYSLSKGERKKTLYELILDTKDNISTTIDHLIFKIRKNGNNALHYDEIKGLITFSEKEAKEHLEWLLQIIDFYVKKFKV
jgi:hypothetical protein